jgi:hypothetical protein
MGMRMSKSKLIGLIAVVAVVVIFGGVMAWRSAQPEPEVPAAPVEATAVNGYLGGEKISLFDDEEFKQLASDANLSVQYRKAGSLAMMDADQTGMDYLFPSSRSAVEYGASKGVKSADQDIVFNSPIVVYTYRDVADAMVGSGIMSKDGDVYRLDTGAAVQAMVDNKTWQDLGWADGYGQFRIDSTDPTKSNSGNEWAALVATMLNGGQPATADSVQRDADKIRTIFQKSGWMETSSEDSFKQFLTLGEGSKPMMVGYESQVLDLAANQPNIYTQAKDELVVAYLTPTVWSTHVIMPLDENGVKLRDFLKSDGVQKLAWEKHGFRTASYTGTDSVSRFNVPGTVDKITSVVELPDTNAMNRLIEVLGS